MSDKEAKEFLDELVAEAVQLAINNKHKSIKVLKPLDMHLIKIGAKAGVLVTAEKYAYDEEKSFSE